MIKNEFCKKDFFVVIQFNIYAELSKVRIKDAQNDQ
jgi:hypothetical protein